MKKYFILLSAALSVFALVSCQKEQDLANEGILNDGPKSVPFVLRASIPSVDTKTTLNTSTWAVDWEDTDVIYAVTTDKAWGEAYPVDADETIAEFAYDSVNGTFSTDKAIADGSHTFKFLYTAGQQKSYHRGDGTTFSLAGTQTFDASAPTANLKTYDALAAQKTATTPTSFADIEMSHLFTLMKVTLKNKTGDSITINKFEVEIPGQNLYGIFNVSFDATPSVSHKQSGGDKITVNISNGAVANNGSLDVFFVMGPIAGYTGNVTFTVTDNNSNEYTKTNTIPGPGVTFAAGTYNTASYTLKTADPIECVTLDWDYPGGTSANLNAVSGVTTSGLGTDYAESNAPYRVKFDGTGDYIQVRTDAAISTVSVGYKMIGGNSTSSLTFKESANGSDWNDVQTLNIAGAQNSTGTLTTTNPFNDASRFVQIYFTKGANVGIGAISIHKLNTDPVISSSDISDVPAAGVTDTWTYTVKNFSDDVEVASFDGCVTDAIADAGSIVYSIGPNYNTTTNSGTIVLQSASDNSVTKTISVTQLASSLTVSTTEVIIPANSDNAEFTITSPEFGWSISADDDSHIVFDETGTASSSASTVSITSDFAATDAIQTIATLTIIRNSNASDPQKKQVVVKKDKTGGSPKTSTLSFTAKCNGSGTADDGVVWAVTSDGTESNFDNTKGIHYGTSSAQVQYIMLSTSDITGSITKVVVNASTASGVSATVGVTVGGNSFGGAAQDLSSTAKDYTFNGSASGAIVVTVTKPEKASKAIYIKSISVTYTN